MSNAPFITLIPETRESIQMAYSRGFISFETMSEKLKSLCVHPDKKEMPMGLSRCIACDEVFHPGDDEKEVCEECDEVLCVDCHQNEKASGMDICSRCDRGGDPNAEEDR